jgi:hypothetical protein
LSSKITSTTKGRVERETEEEERVKGGREEEAEVINVEEGKGRERVYSRV